MITHADPALRQRKIIDSSSYRLAYKDVDFLSSPKLRAARMERILKPDMTLEEHEIESTIVVFGSTRIVEPVEAARRVDDARQSWPSGPTTRCGSGPWPRPSGSWKRAVTMKSPASSDDWSRKTAARLASPSLRS